MPSAELGDVVGEEPAATLGDRVDVAGDAGGHHRRAARGRLGEREPEALAVRRAARPPTPAGTSRPARRRWPGRRTGSSRSPPSARLSASKRARCGPSPTMTASTSGTAARVRGDGAQQVADALLRHQPGHRDHQRASARASPPGVKRSSMPWGAMAIAVGVDAVVLDDLVARRRGGGEQRAAAVRRGARGGARWRGRRGRTGRAAACPTCRGARGGRRRPAAGATTAARRTGTPWKISMMPSAGPSRPQPLVEGGGGEHPEPTAAAHDAGAVAGAPRSGAPRTRPVWSTTSRPAATRWRHTWLACSSEPPASGSSRSRKAKTWMRRSPARSARSAISSCTEVGEGSGHGGIGGLPARVVAGPRTAL